MERKTSFGRIRGLSAAMLGIAALILMAVVGLSYREWRQYNRANVEAAESRAIVDSVDQLLSSLLEAETAQRGYLLTGENRYLTPYDRAVPAIPNELANLTHRLAAHPEESGALARLHDLVTQKLAELQQTIELRRTQGLMPAMTVVLSDRGKRTMDEIGAVCAAIQRRESASQAQTSLEREAAAGTALLITVAGSMLLLFLLAVGLEPFASPDPQAQGRSWPLRYGAAVLAVVMVVLFRMALTPLMGDRSMPFTLFFPAVWFAAWYGGFRPGALSVLLSVLAGAYFFAEPTRSLLVRYHDDQIAMLMLVIVGFGMALLSRSQHRAVLRTMQAENAERNERQRFETTLASIGDAVIATDAEGRVTFANKVALSLMRCAESEITGKPLDEAFRIVNEFTRTAVESPVARVLREGMIVGLANHSVLIARDGTEAPIDDSAAPIRSADGAVQGTVLVFRDITERRRAEERTRLMVEAAPNAMIMVGNNGCIQLVNSQAEKLFGYGREEMLGQPVEMLVPDRYRTGHGALRTSFLRAPLARPMGAGRDLFGLRKDGHEVPIEIGLNPISTGQGDFVLAAIIDISERKLAEERFRAVNDELRRTTHLMEPVACFVRDLEDRIVYWNPGAADLYGFPAEEAIGKISHSLLKAEFPAPLDKIRMQVIGTGAWDGELLHTRRDGQRITVASHWALHQDPNGRPVATLEVNLDISKRKEAEEMLRVTNRALSRANEDLNQFAFAASHDLQEPLRMITNYSQLLLKGYRGQLDGQAAVCVEFITEGTERMRELLADLLAYTQLTEAEQETIAPVDLNEVFQTALENCQAAIEEAGAVVTSDSLPAVLGQKPHFVQLFQNLISNGVKYRGEDAPRIHVSVERQNGLWRLAVRDNGIGIAPEYHKQIFGVFKRLHGRSIPGTGIGLAICQRVVDRYGGQIWVESQVSRGATFYFTLPQQRNGSQRMNSDGVHILSVEDGSARVRA